MPSHARGGALSRVSALPLLLYGLLFAVVGLLAYLFGVFLVFPRYLLGLDRYLRPIAEWLVWYSGVPLMLGFALAIVDLLILFPLKRGLSDVPMEPLTDRGVTVALTAYNDELSIAAAVADFRAHPNVRRVIVVSNNSTDTTFERAKEAGAIVFDEMAPGYGQCVFRCLTEAAKYEDTDLIVLCEGDMTFRAMDIEKLLAYAPHAGIVNGTRTVERLRQNSTQLTTFMYYGNLFAGKLLEAKHLGRGTMTDVGTTYKLCKKQVLMDLLPKLNPAVNLEFNAYFLDIALDAGHRIVECPVTFHPRVGVSKGGNTDNMKSLTVGLRMIRGFVFGWKSK